jgi:hypothetical protein
VQQNHHLQVESLISQPYSTSGDSDAILCSRVVIIIHLGIVFVCRAEMLP